MVPNTMCMLLPSANGIMDAFPFGYIMTLNNLTPNYQVKH